MSRLEQRYMTYVTIQKCLFIYISGSKHVFNYDHNKVKGYIYDA